MSNPLPDQKGNAPNRPRIQPFVWMIPVLIALGLALMVWLPSIPSGTGQTSPAVGKAAPQLDLVVMDHQLRLQRLQSLPKGSVVLLHFWGTWCGPCRMEFPDLAAMSQRYGDSPSFRFLPVSCEVHDGETLDGLLAKTERYYASEGILVPSFADPLGVTRRSLAQRLGSNSLVYPTSVVIDTEGRIAGVWEGYTQTSVEQIEALINQLLQPAADRKAPS